MISIGKAAFDSCFNLADVTIHAPRTSGSKVPNLYEGVFDGNRGPLTIYVPYGSLERYKTAPTWENYESMIYPWLQKSVAGYGISVVSNKWVFIASPLAENTAPSEIEGMIAENATEYDLYRFNQSAAAEWENYKKEGDHYHFELENGRGYLYANKENVDIVFKGTFNEEASQDVSLACSGDGELKGWNLVGNPFPYNATVTGRSFYVMNPAGTGLNPNAGSSGLSVPACNGIVVKAESTETNPIVTFSKPGLRGQSINQGSLQIAVAIDTCSDAVEDMAVISFNKGDQLSKFYFGQNNANIYIPQDNKEYSIVVSEAFGSMPLNFVAKENGRYALTVIPENVEMNYLHLIDNLTGADVDLLATPTVIADEDLISLAPSYTFTAKTTDYASRFHLVFSVSGDANGGDAPFAFINNGQIILVGIDGDAGAASIQIVDVMGRVLVCRDALNASPISIKGMAPGVYVLRLINGDDVKMQKIVVP